jgi:hypothetical protein
MKMDKLLWLVCVAGCGGEQAKVQRPTLDGWQMSVTAPALASAAVTGSFTAVGDGMRAFGGCLLADLHGAKSCTTDADCATGAAVPLATGHHEYCLAAEGETQTTCWTRNAADMAWCNKVPPPGRVAGTYMTPSVDAAALPGSGAKSRWTTLACLNAGTYPMFSDGPLPPCASGDAAAASYFLFVTGAVSTYTAP